MRNITLFALTIFLLGGIFYSAKAVPPVKSIIATYNGLTYDYEFKFTTDDGVVYIFQDISEDVAIDLYEDEAVGLKYEVTWMEEETEITDDEGEGTGETMIYKRIIGLKEVE